MPAMTDDEIKNQEMDAIRSYLLWLADLCIADTDEKIAALESRRGISPKGNAWIVAIDKATSHTLWNIRLRIQQGKNAISDPSGRLTRDQLQAEYDALTSEQTEIEGQLGALGLRVAVLNAQHERIAKIRAGYKATLDALSPILDKMPGTFEETTAAVTEQPPLKVGDRVRLIKPPANCEWGYYGHQEGDSGRITAHSPNHRTDLGEYQFDKAAWFHRDALELIADPARRTTLRSV